MQPKHFIRTLFLTILLAAMILPGQLFAQTREVTVTLPSFPVTLNGIQVDNAYRQYPLIVYKDITYFPMTYYDNRFLGVETNWNRETGLVIDQTGVSAAYREYKWDTKNSKSYQAMIRSGQLELNGKVIDSNDGEYPFLTFRDVTYFPLTWKYAVEQFGWTYHFDAQNGLVIQSSNPQVEKIAPKGPVSGGALVFNGYYYYKGEQGTIMQALIDQPDQAKVVYQLPLRDYGDEYVNAGLTIKEGEIWLNYHWGGAVMGSDYYLRLNADGVFEEVESGYLAFKTFGDLYVKVYQSMPSPDNLYAASKGEAVTRIGDPAYLYGWAWSVNGNGTSGGSGSSAMYLIDNQLYLLAFNMEKDTDYSRIHRVDLATNKTTRVSDLKAENFAIMDDFIYLVSEGKLVRMLHSSSEGDWKEVDSIEGQISWITSESGYLIVTFTEDDAAPYGLIVIDSNGAKVFKTSDTAGGTFIHNGELIYTESTSGDTYSVILSQGD